MPLEPFPWGRKEFFRERKHLNGYDRASEPLVGPVSRWRDSPSHGSRNDFGRWGYPPEFRRPTGHGKQGGWHVYPEDFSHEYSSARSDDRFYQDGGGFRPSGPYRDGRYNRNFRENKGSFNQKGWRSHSWDANNHHCMPPYFRGRSYERRDQKVVDVPPARISHPRADEANTSNQVYSKERDGVPYNVNESITSQKIEKVNSLTSDWKPLKWCRSGSMTSRGSGFSLSSNSKSAGESFDAKSELPLKTATTPGELTPGDAVGCLTSPTSVEDTSSRKKPRLGWGEGLARFEKKNVEGPDDCQTKNDSMESMHSPAQQLDEKSIRSGSVLECRSPVTPSSAVCTSSAGLADKSNAKATEIDSDAYNLSSSPTVMSQNHCEDLSLSPENVDFKSLSNLKGFLNELLQNEAQGLFDSELRKASGVNKLLMFKGEISKTLELTESEIDSLENELKSLSSQPDSNIQCPESSNSMSLNFKEKPSAVLNTVQRPPSLMITSSNQIETDSVTPCGTSVEVALDSPGTATSKFMERLSSEKYPIYDQQEHGCSGELATYEVCTSAEKRIQAKHRNTSVHKQLCVFDNLEESEALSIISSNKETATRASEFFSNLLPCSSCPLQSVETISARCSQNSLLIKEKFLKRERALRFKERALCLKYRVLQYLWKVDLQLLPERKYLAKSQKKVDLSSRSLHGGLQRHRSSVRLQLVSPACKSSLFAKSQMANFTSKLLSSAQSCSYRDGLKMPALILNKQEKTSEIKSNNGLVEHPLELEQERALINPWTPDEKRIFLEKYSSLGKNFRKISSFLDHKTTADCVEFYYKNQKSDLFKETKKLRKKEKSALTTRYLMTSGTGSLDTLGACSAIVAKNEVNEVKSLKIFSSGTKLRINGTFREIPGKDDEIEERETEAADVLASICGSLSSEDATSSYITSSSAEPCSDESCENTGDRADWTDEEKSRFVGAFSSFGKDFGMISKRVRTKSDDQCKVFFGKARKCLGLDRMLSFNGQDRVELGDIPVQLDRDESRRSENLASLEIVVPE